MEVVWGRGFWRVGAWGRHEGQQHGVPGIGQVVVAEAVGRVIQGNEGRAHGVAGGHGGQRAGGGGAAGHGRIVHQVWEADWVLREWVRRGSSKRGSSRLGSMRRGST
ncbi:hypothetical protein E2C01_094418 [Portunus trituberculatus]|uniref:Uncharacterized protein n=1 Tax=Portunus trituberculatus TaxID=210409 RepID=A0A5B7K373_PORTR|nr:hypothetical protein [Portunus trituberculatus]